MGSHAAVDAHQRAVTDAELVVHAMVALVDANAAIVHKPISPQLSAEPGQYCLA